MRKKTILVIINYYLPGYQAGGPVRTTANMVHWLGDDFKFNILTTDRDLGSKEAYPNIKYGRFQPVGKAKVRYLSQEEQNILALGKIINGIEYDLIYLDSIFATPSVYTILLYRLGLIDTKPILIVPRGHLNQGAISLKSCKKKIYLKLASIFKMYKDVTWHASNKTEAEDIRRELPMTKPNKIHVISNLPTPIDEDIQIESKKRIGELNLVFVSRISPKKNLNYALKCMRLLEDHINFGIYGPLEDRAYWSRCKKTIATLPDNIQVKYHGTLKSDAVISTISNYDFFFLPTLGENFGHVIYEALCAGCPVILSDKTPWNHVQQKGAGWICTLEKPEEFRKVLKNAVQMNSEQHLQMRKNAHNVGTNYMNETNLIEELSKLFFSMIS